MRESNSSAYFDTSQWYVTIDAGEKGASVLFDEFARNGKTLRLVHSSPSPYTSLMQLTEADICEFSRLWLEEFNEVLAPDDARSRASQLLALYELLAHAESNGPPKPPVPTTSLHS